MGFFVPQTMKNKKRWVLWRLEDDKKLPFSAHYDGLASSTRANTWSYFSKAVNKLEHGDFNGLGYVFAPEDGLVFIDLDNCVTDEGELSEFAESILELFPATYTEYSQSGKGLHLVVKGSIPRAYKSSQIELYSSGRYMAFTGNALVTEEPRASQMALEELCKRFDIKAQALAEPTARAQLTASDSTILQRAEKLEQFRKLWRGEWEDTYKSQSEADLRLISLLVYYGASDEQVHRLFRSSALGQRTKATEAYIQRTINKSREHTKPLRTAQNGSYHYTRNNLTDTPKKKNSIRRFR